MNAPIKSAKVVLFANDLMLGSTVSGAVSMAGLAYRCVGSEPDAVQEAAADGYVLLLIDLGTAGLDITSLASNIPEPVRKSAIAYGPHVHVAKLEAATEAGIGHVISRGQFSAQIGRIVQDFATAATALQAKNNQ